MTETPARRLGTTALLVSLSAAFAFPLLWMFATALLPESETLSPPLRFRPGSWTFANFQAAWADYPLAAWMRNSLIAATATAMTTLALSAPAAFALARLRPRGTSLWLALLLGAMLVPAEVGFPTLFLGLARAGWSDNYASLVGPLAVNGFGLFLLIQFFRSIPAELLDAAALEGAGAFRTLTSVALPLSVPALVTVGLLSFSASWSNFLWPLIVTNTDATRTLPVGLAQVMGNVTGSSSSMRYGLTMAASAIATLPPLLIFLAASRHFERGIGASSGIRG